MKKILATTALLAMGAAAAQAVQVRYFLTLPSAGLTNPADTESAATPTATVTAAIAAGDPLLDTGGAQTAQRFYLWSLIPATPQTDLLGVNFAFRTTGDVQINTTNIWQNTSGSFVDDDDDPGTPDVFIESYRRWNEAGIPGLNTWNAQTANPTPAVAVLEDGVTNQVQTPADDQRRTVTFQGASSRAELLGWIEVTGSAGDVHVINEASGFLQIDPDNRVFLGLDDSVGALAEVVNVPYDNASPEATLVPEPTSLALLALSLLGLRRR